MTDLCVKYVAAPVFAKPPAAGDKAVIPGWLSVPQVDRSKEFIDGRDMDLDEFNLNPVFLWCHRRDMLPLGKINGLAPRDYGNGYSGLFGDFEFDPNDEFAGRVYKSYANGYLRGFSVGFSPYAGWRPMSPAELERAGHDPSDRVRRMSRGKLYEGSAVPVPDCQLALSVPVVKSVLAAVPDALRAAILDATPPQSTFAADYAKVRPGFPPAGKQSPNPHPATPETESMSQPTAAEAVETTETPAPAAQTVTKAADAPARAEPQKVDITVTVKQEQAATAEKAAGVVTPEPKPEDAPVEKAADEPAETPAADEAVEKAEGGKMSPGAMAHHVFGAGVQKAVMDMMPHAESSEHPQGRKNAEKMAADVCKVVGKRLAKAVRYYPDAGEKLKAMAAEFGHAGNDEPDDDGGEGDDMPEEKPEPGKAIDVAELVTKAVEEQFSDLPTKAEVAALRAAVEEMHTDLCLFVAGQIKR